MFRILRVPVADNHGCTTHRDVIELRRRYVVQHFVEVYDVAVVPLLHIHLVKPTEPDDAVAYVVFGEYLLAIHVVGIIYPAAL